MSKTDLDGPLNRSGLAGVKVERLTERKWWLSEIPGRASSVWPSSGVDEKRVTEVRVTGQTGGESDRSSFELRQHLHEDEVTKGALVAVWKKGTRNVEVRACPNPCWSVVFSDVGQQEQHEEGALA